MQLHWCAKIANHVTGASRSTACLSGLEASSNRIQQQVDGLDDVASLQPGASISAVYLCDSSIRRPLIDVDRAAFYDAKLSNLGSID